MPLNSGALLGPYEVVGLIGAGGMGEVYKARDARLDRMVAIKVLPSTWSQDPDRRARFNREARAVAALSHPNICAIHDVGHQDGVDFLVLEFLDGETLAARLTRVSPLPLDDTIRIATQIADALSAAHRAGIIHRDLKPGNVMVTKTGVKVLDFGLAKLSVAEKDPLVQTSEVETVSALSSAGTVMGTVPYMAPEQIEGRTIDARSDLFAFGAMVYEMATGRRAFQGASSASIMAAILERTPPSIADVQPLTPPGFERLVQKCLAKDPDARWQSASDVADELRWLSGSASATAVTRVASRRWTQRVAWLVAAVAIVAAAVWLWKTARAPVTTPAATEAVQERVTFSGKVVAASLSRDGRSVAYDAGEGGDYRVFVRDLGSGQELEVWKGTRVLDLEWLPDGSQLAIAGRRPTEQGIWIVSRLGVSARRVDVGGTYVAISPDGSRVAAATQTMPGVDVVSLAGGTPRRITGTGFSFLYGIDWTQPNRLLMPVQMSNGERAIVAGAPDAGTFEPVLRTRVPTVAICGSPVADAFYVLTEARLERVALVGGVAQSPEVLLTGLPATSGTPLRTCSVSGDGDRLLHVRRLEYGNVWRLDLDRPARPAVALTKGTSRYHRPQFSNDGLWIVSSGGPRNEIAKIPASGGQPIPMIEGGVAAWAPDGQRLAFVSGRGGRGAIWVGDADGRQARELPDDSSPTSYLTWLPDGRLAWQTADARNYQIHDLTTGRNEFLVEDPSVGWVFVPRYSPKGDRVAIHWNRTQGGLWTLSWPGRQARFLAADLVPDGWSPDGAWIYAHREGTRSIVRVAADTGTIEPVGEFPVGSLSGNQVCDVARDGHAIVCTLLEATADAWVIHHFDNRPLNRQ